ncbi:MAG: glycosyltransferase family 25 protein [Proteobacteria bacterium]|nr:glycosyltransferase family 25 protein [Pseudomonadota bacterium]
MKTYVISLKGSERRRASIKKQLDNAGKKFTFFDAICGADALNHVHHYDDVEFILNCGRSATANEIGCYASHFALWSQCARGSEPFLILEDDARLDPGFVHGFGIVERRAVRWDFIRLSGPYPRWSRSAERSGPFDIRRCQRVPLLALGYVISPRAAARLEAAGGIVKEPVDKFMQRFWLHKQTVVALHPPIVHASTLAVESDIGIRFRPRFSLQTWTQRTIRKSTNSVMRELFNLRQLSWPGWCSACYRTLFPNASQTSTSP